MEYPHVLPELTLVNFQCIDLAGHYFLYFHDPGAFGSMPWAEARRATLAATLGLPVAEDLRGAPRSDWFAAGAFSSVPIAKVKSYDPDVPAPDASETELPQQLKAIGYVD